MYTYMWTHVCAHSSNLRDGACGTAVEPVLDNLHQLLHVLHRVLLRVVFFCLSCNFVLLIVSFVKQIICFAPEGRVCGCGCIRGSVKGGVQTHCSCVSQVELLHEIHKLGSCCQRPVHTPRLPDLMCAGMQGYGRYVGSMASGDCLVYCRRMQWFAGIRSVWGAYCMCLCVCVCARWDENMFGVLL